MKKKWRHRWTKFAQEFCNTLIDHEEDIKMYSPNLGCFFKLIDDDDLFFIEVGRWEMNNANNTLVDTEAVRNI